MTPWTIQSMEFSRPEYWSDNLSLLQVIFPTQGSEPGLPHCRWILYLVSLQGRPGAYKESSQGAYKEKKKRTVLKWNEFCKLIL